jgi:hypothetical protein
MIYYRHMKNVRGNYLTIVLVIAFIIHIISIISIISPNYLNADHTHSTFPNWVRSVNLTNHLIHLVLLYFIWNWKKIAVLLSLILNILTLPIGTYILLHFNLHNSPLYLTVLLVFITISFIITYYPIYRKWEYFK